MSSEITNGEEPAGVSFNPDIDPDVDPDLIAKVKGDAIGDTLYSERFILTTLMKLPKLEKPLSEDEEYEKDLETLWDQTVERDVVKFLLDYNVLDIFAGCLSEEDGRLTEILVGIVANMCAATETRETLERSPESTIAFINLISSTDPLVLVQLMRFFHSVLVFENSGDELIWFQYFAAVDGFVDKFAFVLASSTSSTLLRHSLEALHAICAKFAVIEIRPEGAKTNFVDFFVVSALIDGLIEAFNQVVGVQTENESTSTPTDDVTKFMSHFLDVCVILTQYEEKSIAAFSPKQTNFLECLAQVVRPMCEPVYLFPLCTIVQGYIENLSDILQALSYPWCKNCWKNCLTVFTLISKQPKKIPSSEWEDERTEEIDEEDLKQTLVEIISKIMRNSVDIDETLASLDVKMLKEFSILVNNIDDQETQKALHDVQRSVKKFLKVNK